MRDRLGTARLLISIRTASTSTQSNSPKSSVLRFRTCKSIWTRTFGTPAAIPQFDIKKRMNPAIDAVRRYKVKEPASRGPRRLRISSCGPRQRIKLAKLLLISARNAAAIASMKWSDFDGRGLFVVPEKDSGGVFEPNYHLCPKPLLDALPTRQAEGGLADTILTTMKGTPWASASNLVTPFGITCSRSGWPRKARKP